MDELSALRLQMDWGVDEVLLAEPQNRLRVTPKVASPVPSPPRGVPLPLSVLPAGPADAAKIAANCAKIEDLQEALANFTGCALRDTATQLVFADGAVEARVMLIGDAPAAEDDRSGRPFSGPRGQLLDKMLASIGLDRSLVRITNIVPWRPPGDRQPTEAEIALCLPFLQRHIALLRPDCLILLGAVAAKAMLPAQYGHAGISKLRGKWQSIEIPGAPALVPCLPIYHPAYLLRTPAAKRDSWHDLLALRAWLDSQD
ncbi:MAG: uracil-DNA glycosylase [Acidocella sp.]|nr:uracil-DNA glycosylase [Acidocella sp.]